jgi:LemA protein
MLLLLMFIPVLIFAIIVIYVIAVYNNLVTYKNSSVAAWHQIDVQLARRADLAGNLVETVKGYASHEKTVFEDVAAARSSVMQNRGAARPAGEASSALDMALSRLFAVAENYPDLKASANFMALQAQLTEIENTIAGARQYYNDNVRRYNIAVQRFPANAFAPSFGFSSMEYFEITPAKTEPPKVSFT